MAVLSGLVALLSCLVAVLNCTGALLGCLMAPLGWVASLSWVVLSFQVSSSGLPRSLLGSLAVVLRCLATLLVRPAALLSSLASFLRCIASLLIVPRPFWVTSRPF